MNPDDVSVIIPALNEAVSIATAIESAWGCGAGQVIICDGGSTDQTSSIARALDARVVQSDTGRGCQLRAGTAVAEGNAFVFLHADSRLDQQCLKQLCERAPTDDARSTYWGAYCQRIESDRAVYRWLESGNATRVRLRGLPMGDQGMFVTRAAYDRVGGIADVPLMEDVDLAIRLRRVAWPTLLPGPVQTSARRWQQNGIVRQTLKNWAIQCAHACGVSSGRLHRWYR